MVFRFMIMCVLTFGFLPFLGAYSLTAVDDSSTFSLSYQSWALGMVPIVIGWLIFFLPGLVPGLGPRYIGWALEKLGFVGISQDIKTYCRSSITWFSKLNVKGFKTKLTSFPNSKLRLTDQSASKLSEKLSNSLSKIPEPDMDKFAVGVKKIGESLKTTLTPEGLDHSVILNPHTLELFGLLKRALQSTILSLDLSAADQQFVLMVINALPERPAPGDEALGTSVVALQYPELSRQDLLHQTTAYSVYLDHKTFDAAAEGDLLAGLTILNAILQISVHKHTGGLDDPLLTL